MARILNLLLFWCEEEEEEEEEKYEENRTIFKSVYLENYLRDRLQIWYVR